MLHVKSFERWLLKIFVTPVNKYKLLPNCLFNNADLEFKQPSLQPKCSSIL